MSDNQIHEDYDGDDNEMSMVKILVMMISIAIPVLFVGLFVVMPISFKIYRLCKRLLEDEKRRVDAYYDPDKYKANADEKRRADAYLDPDKYKEKSALL